LLARKPSANRKPLQPHGKIIMESIIIGAVEARALGALVEKEITTPENYPLTLNALVNACNQISNRDPVVSFSETMVMRALSGLREKNLAGVFHGADSRVPRYAHRLQEAFALSGPETAVLCVLLLRGPQTVGELRGRTGRMHEFATLAEVEAALHALATKKSQPLVAKLPRQAGSKESRFEHLLEGDVPLPSAEAARRLEAATVAERLAAKEPPPPAPKPPQPAGFKESRLTRPGEKAVPAVPAEVVPRWAPVPAVARREDERIARLEAETDALRREIAELKRQFADFRKRFE
jgi:uncharacterized protein